MVQNAAIVPDEKFNAKNFVSGDLLAAAAHGNRDAIAALSGLLARHVRSMASVRGHEHRVTLTHLAAMLEKVKEGMSPGQAFGWTKQTGRPSAQVVRDRKRLASDAAHAVFEIAGSGSFGDDLTPVLVGALRLIAGGATPDKAFKWSLDGRKGRRLGSNALRDWEIRVAVRTELSAEKKWSDACRAVCSEWGGPYLVSEELVRKLCRGLKADTIITLPDGIFPLSTIRFREDWKVEI